MGLRLLTMRGQDLTLRGTEGTKRTRTVVFLPDLPRYVAIRPHRAPGSGSLRAEVPTLDTYSTYATVGRDPWRRSPTDTGAQPPTPARQQSFPQACPQLWRLDVDYTLAVDWTSGLASRDRRSSSGQAPTMAL